MANNSKTVYYRYFSLLAIFMLLLTACASVQSPTGGPRDTESPEIVRETPENLTRNFDSENIKIEFNEFIVLKNEYSEISVSPALDIPPVYRARKEILEISFGQELAENTTYTINFGKAIADVNEGNELSNYTYVFSTGNEIDSLSISGNVRSSLTQEKLQDVTVFILPVSQDSLFGKKRASIFTSTDSAGNFRLQNLREDTYRIYALQEQGGDRIYNGQSEQIGFLNEPIILNKNIEGINLQVFKEVPAVFSVLDREIEPDGRITLVFNKPLTEPKLQVIEPAELDQVKTVEINRTRDSAFVWLPELSFDSLKIVVNEGTISMDTVILRRNKRDTYIRDIQITDNISANSLKPGSDLSIILSSPVSTADQSQITLLEDSIQVKGLQLINEENSLRKYSIKYPWRLNKTYILTIAEGTFSHASGNRSKAYMRKFSLGSEDNYGSISINVSVPDTSKSYVVQWLSEREEIFRQDVVTQDTVLNYTTYPTAKYLLRVIYDDNNNGQWDTGNVLTKQQPEKTWTFDKIISLRPNWDLEENLVIPKPQ